MDPSSDNLFVRFKAFIDGIGIFTVFAVVILIVGGLVALFGPLADIFKSGETPEDAAAEIRYKNKNDLEAYDAEVLTDEQIDRAIVATSSSIAQSKPEAMTDKKWVVPGSPTAEGAASEPIDPEQMKRGQQQYMMCGGCHGQQGEGGVIAPSLAASELVPGSINNMIRIQLRGLKRTSNASKYPVGMAALAFQTDQQIADVITYVRNSFGHKASAVKPEQVAALRGEIGKPQLTTEDLESLD